MKAGDVVATNFRVGEILGEGGLGELWEALDVARNQAVVLEMLATRPGSQAARARERFRAATANAAKVKHPGLAEVLAVEDGVLVLRAFRGRSLRRLLDKEGPLAERRAMAIAWQILEALKAGHAAGMLHLELAPETVWVETVGTRDKVVVLDMGFGKLAERDPNSLMMSAGDNSLRATPFMAPERISGTDDARTDVYSVGAILYTLINDQPPYKIETFADAGRILFDDAPPPTLRAQTPGLAGVVARALKKKADQRFPDAATFADALLDLAAPR